MADALIYIGAIAVALAAIGGILHFAVVKPLKRWIALQARPAQQALEQVQPNGGTQETARHVLEQVAADVAELKSSDESIRQLAASAVKMAEAIQSRLDQHLQDDHAPISD